VASGGSAVEPVDGHFLDAVRRLERDPHHAPRIGDELLLELFDAQVGSRHLDLAARELRARGQGFYTIGSSGHESNAAVAAALRPTDPALLHYRSGGFYLQRASQAGHGKAMYDVLLGVVAATDEPIAGGRHKVFGHHDLAVIPQTSTIASHLPRALGVAFSITRAAKLGSACAWPEDALTVCSFGDASLNHSTATGAINAACHTSYQGIPLPLLLVCEDNGIGISVRTPQGWVERTYRDRPGLPYFVADGTDIEEVYDVAAAAAELVRTRKRPAFLHLRTVRLMGHAGSDVEASYRSPAELAADLDRDPLLGTARAIVSRGLLDASAVAELYEAKRAEVRAIADEVATRPRLASAAEVMEPLPTAPARTTPARTAPLRPRRATPAPEQARITGQPQAPTMTVAQGINSALSDILTTYPQAMLFGEDVARKGGVYGVTRGLLKKHGAARVFDTLLDEQSVLGLALGAGVSGLLPIPEIQYLAYLHNAEDQLRGEAATLPFFSQGQYRNPMVVRVAAYGYQKGFGGHFHNDNALGVLRDIPGLVIASPARPDDAAAMLRTCAAQAVAEGTVSVFLEPIALYHQRDLYDDGDGGWLAPDDATVPVGAARTYGEGRDLTIVTFGNGLYLSLRAARRLERRGIAVRVVDLRWLAPLPYGDLLREANATGTVLVVDETRRTGGVSEGVVTALVDAGYDGRLARVASEDSFVPLGEAARHVLVSEQQIETAATALLERRAPQRRLRFPGRT
jgi:2-oxoisovalerate dehydrogenase E1 component